MNHLLLFTIGPVQSFIAQARKTKDLYAGSQILSKLCKVGITTAESFEAKIIFPYVDKNWQNQSLPNRFIAKIDSTKNAEAIKQIGIDIENAIREDFEKQADNLLSALKLKNIKSTNFKEAFWKQIKGHLDIHWVIVPIKEGETYLQAFEKTERILGSVKNLRSFTQNAEVGRKCSLDGQNNALFFGFRSNRNYVRTNSAKFSKDLAENEGLSAVSMLKRNVNVSSFPSTAGIAVMDAIHKGCKFEIALNEYVEYRNIFNGEFDEQLLFEENLTNKYFEKNELRKYVDVKDNKLPEIREKQKTFENKLKSFGIFLPKYYALIHFDGDKMGSLISGSRLQNPSDKSDEKLPVFQKRVSELLSDFSKWASETCLIPPKGQTVYAGGDDFLGFMNLTHLLTVMQELREGFDCKVNKILKAEYQLDDFTFSAGIVIAHYKEPLSLVLEQVRQAEKIAKDKGDRNAFCLVASKGSGEIHQTCFKWNHHGIEATLVIAQKLVEWLSQDKISKKFIISFANEMQKLMEDEILGGIDYEKIINAELKRLMLRAKASSTDKADVIAFTGELFSLYQNQENANSQLGIGNFLQFLSICDFISRHINQPKPELV